MLLCVHNRESLALLPALREVCLFAEVYTRSVRVTICINRTLLKCAQRLGRSQERRTRDQAEQERLGDTETRHGAECAVFSAAARQQTSTAH